MAIGIIPNIGGGTSSRVKNIFENGALASGLTLTENIGQYGDLLRVRRDANGNGGYIEGIDLTKIASIRIDNQWNSGNSKRLQAAIEGRNLGVVSATTARNTLICNVSAFQGINALRLMPYGDTGIIDIYNITCQPYPKFDEYDVIKEGFLNPKYEIVYGSGSNIIADHLGVSYGDYSTGGATIPNIDLTNIKSILFDYINTNATYRLFGKTAKMGSTWQSVATTNRANSQMDVSGVTGMDTLRLWVYGDANQSANVYNIKLIPN